MEGVGIGTGDGLSVLSPGFFWFAATSQSLTEEKVLSRLPNTSTRAAETGDERELRTRECGLCTGNSPGLRHMHRIGLRVADVMILWCSYACHLQTLFMDELIYRKQLSPS